jgi:hypothetical protein
MARLTLSFDEDTIRDIAALAAEQGISKSAWLAQEIRTFVRTRAHHPAYWTESATGCPGRRSAQNDQ